MKCAAQGHTVVYVELWLAPKLTVLIPEEWQEGREQASSRNSVDTHECALTPSHTGSVT